MKKKAIRTSFVLLLFLIVLLAAGTFYHSAFDRGVESPAKNFFFGDLILAADRFTAGVSCLSSGSSLRSYSHTVEGERLYLTIKTNLVNERYPEGNFRIEIQDDLSAVCEVYVRTGTEDTRIFPSNRTYQIADTAQGLTAADLESATILCQNFLSHHFQARAGKETLDIGPYFVNENLKTYVTALAATNPFSKPFDSFESKVLVSELHQKEDCIFVTLSSSVGWKNSAPEGEFMSGSSDVLQFLVNREGERLVIADCYSNGKGVSAFFTEHRSPTAKIDDPTLWENNAWVADFFLRTGIPSTIS